MPIFICLDDTNEIVRPLMNTSHIWTNQLKLSFKLLPYWVTANAQLPHVVSWEGRHQCFKTAVDTVHFNKKLPVMAMMIPLVQQ